MAVWFIIGAVSKQRTANALKKSTRILLIALCVVLVGVCIWAAYNIIRTELGYHKAANTYNDLANTYASVTSTPAPTSPLVNGVTKATPEPLKMVLMGFPSTDTVFDMIVPFSLPFVNSRPRGDQREGRIEYRICI